MILSPVLAESCGQCIHIYVLTVQVGLYVVCVEFVAARHALYEANEVGVNTGHRPVAKSCWATTEQF